MAPKMSLKKRFSKLSVSGFFSSSESDVSRSYDPSPASTTTSFPYNPPAIVDARPPSLEPGDVSSYTVGHKVTAAEVRELHDLIRRRCEVDVYLWAQRDGFADNRGNVKKQIDRSDAILARIVALVQSWDTRDAWGSDADWKRLREIRKKVEEPGKRNWAENPPWEEEEEHVEANLISFDSQPRQGQYRQPPAPPIPVPQRVPYTAPPSRTYARSPWEAEPSPPPEMIPEELDSHLSPETYREAPPPQTQRIVSPYTPPIQEAYTPPIQGAYTPYQEYPRPTPSSPMNHPSSNPRNVPVNNLAYIARAEHGEYSQQQQQPPLTQAQWDYSSFSQPGQQAPPSPQRPPPPPPGPRAGAPYPHSRENSVRH